MSQHGFDISDQNGVAFLADLNNALAALAGNNSGASEPSATFAHMWWPDTTAGIVKQRNAANDGWIERFNIEQSLTNVDNTSDTNKPISTLTQTALDAKKGGLLSVQIFNSSGTWTRPAGVGLVRVIVVGGGGGGGGVDGQGSGTNAGGSGGSGGSNAEKVIDVSSISSATITIGGGGNGGAAGNNNGVAGTSSIWSDGTNTLTGSGGGFGRGSLGTSVVSWVNANGSPIGTGGDVNGRGWLGGPGGGQVQNTAKGGHGGGTIISGSGPEIVVNASATAGVDAHDNTGGGGGGAATENVNTNASGGDGGDGIVIVYEYAA
jgi:hypothetical protein